MEGYEIFEAIRNKKDGGTLIGVHQGLNPVLIKEYSEKFELLVVEISVLNKDIRIISGYGPQESWPEDERMPFFLTLEEEINKAEMLGKSIFIEMDAYCKLGNDFIANDPHNQTNNGKILAGIIRRRGLVVGNGMKEKCTGLITRKRITTQSIEESIIDFDLISNDLTESVQSIEIDDQRKYVLTKHVKTKHGMKSTESDHNIIVTKLKLPWSKKTKKHAIELFNLKNVECQNEFRKLTSNSNFLSSIFDDNRDINAVTKKFIKRLNGCLHKWFRKIKLTDKQNLELESLFKKRNDLRAKNDEKSKNELKHVEEELAHKCAKENYEKIKDEIDGIKCEEGGFNSGKLWKLKKKFFPHSRDPPTAMLDDSGNLVTNPDLIKELLKYTEKGCKIVI